MNVGENNFDSSSNETLDDLQKVSGSILNFSLFTKDHVIVHPRLVSILKRTSLDRFFSFLLHLLINPSFPIDIKLNPALTDPPVM